MSFEKNLDKYAKLAIKVGVNIQEGQTLLVRSPIECAPFVRKVVKHAYEAGAKNVHIEWSDEECTLLKYLHAPDETFNEFPRWISDQYVDIAKEGGAFLTVYAQNPDLLKNVDPQRVANFQKASGVALKEWRSYTLSDKCKWSIVSIPTKAWATKVFPNVSTDEAVNKLWDAIFKCTRVDNEDPVDAWRKHNADLKLRMDFLNDKNFKTLKFKSSKTDLTMELPEGHIWLSGASKDPNGVDFNANMPTEEVFSMPHKFKVNGIVHSTKPLVYGGNVIDNFALTFKDGKIVDCKGNDTERLNQVFNTGEGARYIGEFAIGVNPYITKPMNNILFDEKIMGSIHFTPGNCYDDAYNGNKSAIHWDLVLIQTEEYGGGEIYFDDRLIRKNGRFVIPELETLNPENLK